MFQDFSAAAALVREHGIRMIDLKFTDLWGRWHHVTLSATEFSPGLMEAGVGFDGSSVGLRSVKSGDMALIPDLTTGCLDPFWDVPTLSFICFTVEADSKRLYFRDPRVIARRAEEFMQGTGFADESRWGPEFEFYVFDKVSFENGVNVASYRVDSVEADWHSGEGGHGHYVPLHGGYHAIPPRDQLYNLRSRIVTDAGRDGRAGEIPPPRGGRPRSVRDRNAADGVAAGRDASQMIKYVAKMVARQTGQTVTFMPKPLYGEAGNGMHFHQHLFKGGANLFYDPQGYSLLSQTALLLHRRAADARARRCWRSPIPAPTPTAAWCPASRPRSTASSRWATAARRSASLTTPPSRTRCASNSARLMLRVTPTWRWPRC